jgi:TolB-like protein
MQRDHPASTAVFVFDSFRLDRRSGLCRLQKNGEWEPIDLGSRALDVLGMLIEQRGELVTKDQIMTAAWPGLAVEPANLTVQIAALRRVLDADRTGASCIQTVIGRGYRFLPDVTQGAEGRRATDPPAPETALFEPPRLSIVVLPFANLSDDRDQQFLADGITMDLTTDLSRIRGALVISCNTAFTYRNRPTETTQIARELDVRFVLEGSVQRSGNRIRVNAQLIDGLADSHIWAERFDDEVGNLAGLQDEVVCRIAGALNVELMLAEAARPTRRLDAMECIFRGHALATHALSRDVYVQRIKWYEQACAFDPRSVEALSRLAISLAGRVLDNMSDCVEADLARAETLIEQALAISPLGPLAHFARGHLLRAQNRWEESIPEYEAAVASNRNWAAAIGWLGGAKMFAGLLDEVIPLEERAIRLSPRDPERWIFYHYIGQTHFLRFRFDEAIPWFERSRACQPTHGLPHAFLAAAYAWTADAKRASFHLSEARRLSNGKYDNIAGMKTRFKINVPEVAALLDRTYFAGMIKAGVPEA